MTNSDGRWRQSPALIVAGVALVVALGGTAVALPGKNNVDGNDLRKGVVKAKNIGKGAVTAPKLRNGAVNSAKIRNGAVAPADLAPAARSPRAYALVTASNDVDEAASRGVTDAMVTIEGDVFCFNDLPFEPRHAQVSVDRIGVNGDVIAQVTVGETAGCAGEEDASVRLFDVSANDNQIGPDFYVAFHD